MLTFATRFVLKVVVGKTPIRFDLKTGLPQRIHRASFAKQRCFTVENEMRACFQTKLSGASAIRELSDQGFKAKCTRNLPSTRLALGSERGVKPHFLGKGPATKVPSISA